LFRRAIAQSIPSGQRTADEAAAVTATIAAAAGVPATVDGFAALPPEAILAVQDAPLTGPGSGLTAFGPVVDGDLVAGPPWTAVRSDVDLVCGFTDEEFLGHGPVPPNVDLAVVAGAFGLDEAAAGYRQAYPGRTDADLFVVLASDAMIRIPTSRVAEAHARAGGRTWLYDFAWRSPGLGAGHGVDVAFTFGNGGSRFAARFLGAQPHPDFADLSERVRKAWTAFAATGDPGWPRYEPTRRVARIWDVMPTDVDDPIRASRLIWDQGYSVR
jgi:para-nitrobenzyl esterase